VSLLLQSAAVLGIILGVTLQVFLPKFRIIPDAGIEHRCLAFCGDVYFSLL